MKVFVPPLKCQGIKTKLVPWIQASIALDSHQRWIEPFMGSGVVGFNLRPSVAIFADINPHIITLYNAIKQRLITPTIAKAFLEEEGAYLAERGQQHFNEVRARFNKSPNPLDFLFLSRSSFNGVMRFNRKGQYNVPFGHKPLRFAKAYITKIVNQIDYVAKACEHYDWTFMCCDFREVFQVTLRDACSDIIYCDPPYIGRHVDYYDSWSEADESDLYTLLCATDAKFVLSTWSSTAFRTNTALEKYRSRFHVRTQQHFYHVGASERNRNEVVEALVMSTVLQSEATTHHNAQPTEQLICFPL
jgi:DNA adenine methylase